MPASLTTYIYTREAALKDRLVEARQQGQEGEGLQPTGAAAAAIPPSIGGQTMAALVDMLGGLARVYVVFDATQWMR